METQRDRSYGILAAIQAGLGGFIVLALGVGYLTNPTALLKLGPAQVAVALGIAGVSYYLSVYQLLKKNHPALSVLIGSIIAASNLLLIILLTGGLDSPFYSFWLLVLVAAGLFGHATAAVTLVLTLAAFVYSFGVAGFQLDYIVDKLPQLLTTMAATGLAEWVYSRSRRVAGHNEALTGQLGAAQLTAQALMANMADGVVVVDRGLNIQLFNHAAQTMTGWDEDSARGINYRTVMGMRTADDAELTDQTDPFVEAWTNHQPTVKNNLSMVTRAGRKIALTMSISPLFDNAGQPMAGIAVFRDISKQKEVERQRDEFISTASHEMRTPVAAIEGYISLAMSPRAATIDDRALGYLTKAHDNVRHLGELFKDLLSATKMEEGSISKAMQPVNLSELVQGVATDMQTVAASKGLTVTFTGTSTLASKSITPIYTVMGDPERLREVTMNLIDNAIKYTPQGGVTVNVSGDDNNVVVAISDTGLGIAREDMPHLFQKFYRIDNSATRTIGGTGLGLYLCRSIVELHNGRIWVTSEPGKGSTFYYSLPRVPNDTVAAPAPVSTPAPTTTETVSVLVESAPPSQTSA